MPVLEVRDLVKHYPIAHSSAVVAAVNGVSFRIGKGETLGVVGESGSGKSTVARCILNLSPPTAGSIVFSGRDISRLPPKEARRLRRHIQLVFQEPFDSLNPRMTVRTIVAEPLRMDRLRRRQREQRVKELLDLVHLPSSLLDHYPHELSGGLQQRVGIARAVATSPALLVLDEPTSALDPRARRHIIDLLVELQRELEMSYLFITHDLNTLGHISHRIAVMYLGLIVEEAPTEALFAEQRHPYSRALLSSVLFPDPETRRLRFELRGEIPSPIDLPEGCHLASRCPLALEECRRATPPLVVVGDGRTSACIRHELVPAAPESGAAMSGQTEEAGHLAEAEDLLHRQQPALVMAVGHDDVGCATAHDVEDRVLAPRGLARGHRKAAHGPGASEPLDVVHEGRLLDVVEACRVESPENAHRSTLARPELSLREFSEARRRSHRS